MHTEEDQPAFHGLIYNLQPIGVKLLLYLPNYSKVYKSLFKGSYPDAAKATSDTRADHNELGRMTTGRRTIRWRPRVRPGVTILKFGITVNGVYLNQHDDSSTIAQHIFAFPS